MSFALSMVEFAGFLASFLVAKTLNLSLVGSQEAAFMTFHSAKARVLFLALLKRVKIEW